ncbi:MAG: branched-chain amino acid ABC transporter permease [Syntrophomonadaceae bacterium]|jgi:branched-chain amino acid transport system permease protein|nr:branched-chain amino acid ABC transporter permease [Syntrophomonadaceae bacterium]
MKYFITICILSGINIITVSGLAVLTGFCGIFSMGHAGFMAIGGYFAACMNIYAGVHFIPAIIMGGAAAALVSLPLGYVTLKNKLSGDYFAIAMLGFGESVRLIIANTKPYIQGAMGLTGIPKKVDIWVVLAFAAIIVYFIGNFLKSQYGKNLTAIRLQDEAAEMMGVPVMENKIWVFAISAFTAGIGGALYGFFTTTLYPGNFGSAKSTDILAAVVFGGINSLTGPIIAAVLLVALPELLRVFAAWRLVVYGLMFVVIMLFRPEGLLGYKEFSFPGIIRFLKIIFHKIIPSKGGIGADEGQ